MKIGSNKYIILNYLKETEAKDKVNFTGCTTEEIAKNIDIQRSNVSKILNELHKSGKVTKIKGKPVLYKAKNENDNNSLTSFNTLIGKDDSLKNPVRQAKAAMIYPPCGLNTMLLGDTGVGKTMFAEMMHDFAIEQGILKDNAPFISFNCADYASNPQLLMARLFGAKKGAFTGADRDRQGLVEQADNGILFLDEIHRLPHEGQEMLFYIMDRGEFSELGNDSNSKKKVNILIICATTDPGDNNILGTFKRRIPVEITIPSLKDRTLKERLELIKDFFKIEASKIQKQILIPEDSLKALLLYNCEGNIGQLKNDIKLVCANGFLNSMSSKKKSIFLGSESLKESINDAKINIKEKDNILTKLIPKDKVLVVTKNNCKFTKNP